MLDGWGAGPRMDHPDTTVIPFMRRFTTSLVLGVLALALLHVETARAQAADSGTAAAASDSARITPAMIEQGRQIFHGRGTCHACHGDKLKGGPIAPSLRGPGWRHIDGTYASIVNRVTNGLKGTVMPAHPGGINDDQIKLVAAYVYAVSHGMAQP